MEALHGGKVNYYLVKVDHPQREDQPPYQAECEDIAEALQLTPNEFCEFKAIWRTAAARLGNGKPGQKALYDAQKRVHYATRDLRKLERELEPTGYNHAVAAEAAALHDQAEAQRAELVDPWVTDGWTKHTTGTFPEDVHEDALVDVVLEEGTVYTDNFAKKMKDWVWLDDGMVTRITHYRLTHIEQPPAPEPDAWVEHVDICMPAGVGSQDWVEVKLSNGHEVVLPRKAGQWNWVYRQDPDSHMDAPHITHWRRHRQVAE